MEKVDEIFAELKKDDFITQKGFKKYRFEEDKFYCLGSTLVSKSGREITVSFIIKDLDQDRIELCMDFSNKCSLEQIRVVGDKLAKQEKRELEVYQSEDDSRIMLVSYYDTTEIEKAIRMMKCTLETVNKVVLFVI